MIELPEAVIIARQITDTLRGKRIKSALRGNSPHKFAFYTRSPDEYAAILAGKTVGAARADGGLIVIDVLPGWNLVLGGGGERIVYHPDPSTVPDKHQFLLRFEDESCLSVRVQGWGACQLFDAAGSSKRWCGFDRGLMPTDPGFTPDYFNELFSALPADDVRSIKFFIITKPGVRGVGNGYLQDVLFRAGLHPRRLAASLTAAQRKALYKAIATTVSQAIERHGRDDEHDLFDQPGGYARTLSAAAAGKPCPRCRARIVKESFLGGAIYFCPKCQEPPPRSAPRAKPKKT